MPGDAVEMLQRHASRQSGQCSNVSCIQASTLKRATLHYRADLTYLHLVSVIPRHPDEVPALPKDPAFNVLPSRTSGFSHFPNTLLAVTDNQISNITGITAYRLKESEWQAALSISSCIACSTVLAAQSGQSACTARKARASPAARQLYLRGVCCGAQEIFAVNTYLVTAVRQSVIYTFHRAWEPGYKCSEGHETNTRPGCMNN
ncbi:hypothetical protein F5I97DRAFT_928817 [Phlebopus sp. FC_14]|nr:hypothetical protein F5I97DRAFT_928817 [Phlebopus sp. FC_14]